MPCGHVRYRFEWVRSQCPSCQALSATEKQLVIEKFEPNEVKTMASEMDGGAGDSWSDSGGI